MLPTASVAGCSAVIFNAVGGTKNLSTISQHIHQHPLPGLRTASSSNRLQAQSMHAHGWNLSLQTNLLAPFSPLQRSKSQVEGSAGNPRQKEERARERERESHTYRVRFIFSRFSSPLGLLPALLSMEPPQSCWTARNMALCILGCAPGAPSDLQEGVRGPVYISEVAGAWSSRAWSRLGGCLLVESTGGGASLTGRLSRRRAARELLTWAAPASCALGGPVARLCSAVGTLRAVCPPGTASPATFEVVGAAASAGCRPRAHSFLPSLPLATRPSFWHPRQGGFSLHACEPDCNRVLFRIKMFLLIPAFPPLSPHLPFIFLWVGGRVGHRAASSWLAAVGGGNLSRSLGCTLDSRGVNPGC